MAGTPEFSRTYARITTRLLESVTTASVPGREALAGELLRRIADTIVAACEERVTADSLPERLSQALIALDDEGLLYESTEAEGTFVLSRLDCRWSRMVADSTDASLYEARILSTLLRAEVQPIQESNLTSGFRLLVRAIRA
jgi:predicted ArsR family transcriptional regulator